MKRRDALLSLVALAGANSPLVAAKAMKLVIPQAVLLRADRVIE